MRTPAELLALRVKQLTAHTKDLHKAVATRKRWRVANKAWCNKKKKLHVEKTTIHKGDLVLHYDTKLDNQHTDKLADHWVGPYLVHKVLDRGAYVLTELDGSRPDRAYTGNCLKRNWAPEPAEDVERSMEETVEENSDIDIGADSDIDVDADGNADSNMGNAETGDCMEYEGDVEDMGSQDEGSQDKTNQEVETGKNKGFFVLIS